MKKEPSAIVNLLVFALFAHFWVGLFYWWWMAYDFGSWWMWLGSLFPPFTVVAVCTAVWSMYLGIPEWVYGMFG